MLDCIIIGAGPAGSGAAYHLAKRGRSVLVLEREALPRYKACAGGISPQIATWYDFSFEPVISQRVDRIGFTWKLGDPVEAIIDTPEPMWMVKREVFDHYLVQQAQHQGAVIQDQTTVTGASFQGDHWQVKTATTTHIARYVIAADGCNSAMAKALGLHHRRPRTSLTLELPITLPPDQARYSHFEFGLIKNGYVWYFPKADRLTFNAATMVGGAAKDLQSPLFEYVRHFGFDPALGTLHPSQFSLWDGHHPLQGRQGLLVGDAAGLADPFSTEGVRPAMLSGLRAAETLDRALNGEPDRSPTALAAYTAALREDWNNDMVWASRIAGLFYRVTNFGYQIGVKRPSARARMGKILCGDLRYRDVSTRALKLLGSKLIPGSTPPKG
ncbi:NAD(P)/FAD-dependent oxidoreductase [Prochlorothrix hollandica]|uniref:NAD(P)/FAD-dependent oxidoreductase n=1 Tax=Prochlorothrix hollandica TaxID=1223 RepID=UPI00333F7ECB